jgi:hypothetical protein
MTGRSGFHERSVDKLSDAKIDRRLPNSCVSRCRVSGTHLPLVHRPPYTLHLTLCTLHFTPCYLTPYRLTPYTLPSYIFQPESPPTPIRISISISTSTPISISISRSQPPTYLPRLVITRRWNLQPWLVFALLSSRQS